MKEYNQSKQGQKSRAIAYNGGGSRQLRKIVDNRSASPKQTDTVRNINVCSDAIQRAATYEEINYPTSILNYRKLTKNEYGRVDVNPSFGRNLGYIDNPNNIGVNIEKGSHTEKVLLSKKYGGFSGNGSYCNWSDIKSLMNAPSRQSFTLYTERKPCDDCDAALQSNAFRPTDKVQYSYEGTSDEQFGWIEFDHKNRIDEVLNS